MDSSIASKTNEVLQNKLQNGPLLLSRLRYKVARLEVALRDKESQLLRLQASTKVTTANELKLQSQIYYDEILRLKSQLNLLQNQQQQQPQVHVPRSQPLARVPPNPKIIENRKKEKRLISKQTQSPSFDRPSSTSILKLEEENRQLNQKLDEVESEKRKLEKDYALLGTKISKSRDAAASPTKHDASSTLLKEQNLSIKNLKSEIRELKNRENAWLEEKMTYKEILDSIKEDRGFYKDMSIKKDEDVEALQKEVLKLQQEVYTIQKDVAQNKLKPEPCNQCSERIKREMHISTSNASTETCHSYLNKRSPRDSSCSSENIARKSKSNPKCPPLPPDKEANKRSMPKVLYSQNHPANHKTRPCTPPSSSRTSSVESSPKLSQRSISSPREPHRHSSSQVNSSPSHNNKGTVASPSGDSESSLTKSTPSSPSSSKQQRSSSVRRTSLNNSSTKSSRENSKSSHISRRASHSIATSSTSSSKSSTSITNGVANPETGANNNVLQSTIGTKGHKSKADDKDESADPHQSPVSAIRKESTASPDEKHLIESSIILSPVIPQRDWIDDEVAQEIVDSQRFISQATSNLNSIFEAHFRRKALLEQVPPKNLKSRNKADDNLSGSTSSPKSYLQLESPDVQIPSGFVSLLQGHLSRRSLLKDLPSS